MKNKRDKKNKDSDIEREWKKALNQQTPSEDNGVSARNNEENNSPPISGWLPKQEKVGATLSPMGDSTGGGDVEIDLSPGQSHNLTPLPPDNFIEKQPTFSGDINEPGTTGEHEDVSTGTVKEKVEIKEEEKVEMSPVDSEKKEEEKSGASADSIIISGDPIENVPSFSPDGTDDKIGYNKIAEAIYELIPKILN